MNLKSTGIDRLSRNYYVKFQVFPIRGFRFIALTYTPTYAHCDKVIAISTPPYYVVGAYNMYVRTRSHRELCKHNSLQTVITLFSSCPIPTQYSCHMQMHPIVCRAKCIVYCTCCKHLRLLQCPSCRTPGAPTVKIISCWRAPKTTEAPRNCIICILG